MDETKEKIDTNSVSEKENEETRNLDDKIIDLRDGITAYEGKMLTVIIGAIVTLIFSLVMYYFREDISDNLTYIVITFICAIAGVSSLEQIMDALKGRMKKQKTDIYNRRKLVGAPILFLLFSSSNLKGKIKI